MSRMRLVAVPIVAVALALAAVPAVAQQQAPFAYGTEMTVVDGKALQWAAIEVPGFASGMKVAGVSGDPAVAGQPYVLRLAFPAGYRFPSHWHPQAENLTVLEGEILLAMGDKADESKLQKYGPGDFLMLPGKHPHFGGATTESVIQLHGMGPFEIKLTSTDPPPATK